MTGKIYSAKHTLKDREKNAPNSAEWDLSQCGLDMAFKGILRQEDDWNSAPIKAKSYNV